MEMAKEPQWTRSPPINPPHLSPSLFSHQALPLFPFLRLSPMAPMAAAAATTSNSFLLQNPLRASPRCLALRPNPRFSVSCAAVTSAPSSSISFPAVALGDRGVFNFAAGPATLPEPVLLKAQAELYNYRGSGMSIMEMSHRGKEFDAAIKKAEADLRLLLSIPDDYAVLFLQGGATTQFAAVPLNLCLPSDSADYLVTGSWGDKAFKEAQKFRRKPILLRYFLVV